MTRESGKENAQPLASTKSYRWVLFITTVTREKAANWSAASRQNMSMCVCVLVCLSVFSSPPSVAVTAYTCACGWGDTLTDDSYFTRVLLTNDCCIIFASDAPGQPTVTGLTETSILLLNNNFSQSTSLKEGDTLKLKCTSIGGYPVPSVRWTKLVKFNATSTSSSSSSSSSNGGFDEREIPLIESRVENNGASVSSEIVLRLTRADNGASVKCLASNDAINTPLHTTVALPVILFASDVIKVTPEDSIKVQANSFPSLRASSLHVNKMKYRHQTSAMDKSIEVTCETGDCLPPCNLTWFHGGIKLLETVDTTVSPSSNGGFVTLSRLNLVKKWTSHEDGTSITCSSTHNALMNRRITRALTVHVLCEFAAASFSCCC